MSLPLLHELTSIKSSKELAAIVHAQTISESVLKEILPILVVGITEKAVAELIIKKLKKKGVKSLPFPPIVAFGKGTADVHHVPCMTKLQYGDTIVIDMGAVVSGYCSDMTRTYFFGPASKAQVNMYNDVLVAQEKVLKAIKEGERKTGNLDAIARTYLNKKFGKEAFPHTLGHGIGRVIHEWPTLRTKTKDILKPGMVITIEPGVYIPKIGGVRIEDLILIIPSGYKNLTTVSKKLEDSILPYGTYITI